MFFKLFDFYQLHLFFCCSAFTKKRPIHQSKTVSLAKSWSIVSR